MSDERTWAAGKILVNDLCKVVSTLPTREVCHSTANTFIPCFGMMFHLLATMNNKVCTLQPFGENGTVNDWIPQISVIVFSVLAYVQTLRSQQLAGINITTDQFNFLSTFMSRLPLETIEIPGPLIPCFRSLSISSPGFGNFQDVTSIIPQLVFIEAHLFNMDDSVSNTAHFFEGIHMMLHNIPLMLDQFVHLVKYLISGTVEALRKYSSYEQLRKIFNMSTLAVGSPLAPYLNRLKQSIGFWHRPTASNGLMLRFANYMCNASTAFPHPWAFDPNHAAIAAKSTRRFSLCEHVYGGKFPVV
ncbi:hypothetical protein Ddye_004494 [Dipteronia dyeriana]|uniref:Uncharacterized protein n=1 Tax=Dipteronia dyeriana TaxID=168575 RepID=A0AAE0CWD1_9ROSI|nr:hypothetical protein Ddye_004494 [Dipteronia dyeriana]